MKFEILTWNDIVRMSLQLCKKIKKSNFNPTVIITILRGGLVPARILSDCLQINRFHVMGVSFYTDVASHKGEPVITQPLSVNLEGHIALLVDDVVDTGESIEVAKEHILSLGAKNVKVATLHKKPWAKFIPDFYLSESDSWIVYPWEYYETLNSLRRKLSEAKNSDEKKSIEAAINEIEKKLNEFIR